MKSGDIASAIGKGLVAGAIGTVAITASQMLAQRFLGQEPSDTPAAAAEKVVGIEPKGEKEKSRLNWLMHFAYGSAWGIPRAIMELFGLRGTKATAAHFAAVQSTATGMIPALGLGPPPNQWPKKQIALESLHHAVYAAATGLALGALDRRSEQAQLAA
jgi:hypothetical protein